MQMGLYVVIVFKTDAIMFQSKTMYLSAFICIFALVIYY